MKQVSPQLKNAMAQETTSLCNIWKITLTNGTEFHFTDLDRSVTVDGVKYKPNPGMVVSAIRNRANGGVQNGSIVVAVSPDGPVREEDLRRNVWDDAKYTLWMIDWQNPGYGTMVLASGTLGEVMFTNNGYAEITISGLGAGASRSFGEIYSQECRNDFGDDQCRYPVDELKKEFTITSTNGDAWFESDDLTEEDGYWNWGWVTMDTGENASYTTDVVTSVGPVVNLGVSLPYPLKVGDTGTIWPGCSKQLSMCHGKYDNVKNIRAEPHVPGTEIRDIDNGPPEAAPPTSSAPTTPPFLVKLTDLIKKGYPSQ